MYKTINLNDVELYVNTALNIHEKSIKKIMSLPEAAEALAEKGDIVIYDKDDSMVYPINRIKGKNVLDDCFNAELPINAAVPVIYVSAKGVEKEEEKPLGFNKDELYTATTSNKLLIKVKPQKCGCIFCKEIFDSSEITEYTRESNGTETAICPHCGMDGILPEIVSPVPLTKEMLEVFDV